MGSDGKTTLSRRMMLGASVGASLAAVGQALGRPAPALANNGDAVLLGGSNFETARTAIYQQDTNSSDQALLAYTFGAGPALASTSVGGHGAILFAGGSASAGAYGQANADSTGVMGLSMGGPGTPPDPESATGVFGVASQETSSKGVYGLSVPGIGVKGETKSTTGVGGLFAAPPGGRALAVFGRAFFNQSGVAHVPAGRSYVDISVSEGLVPSSAIIATIQGQRPGVAVSSVRPRYPSPGKARIYLTKVASSRSRTAVAWFVFG
jgi:hypothetical protein